MFTSLNFHLVLINDERQYNFGGISTFAHLPHVKCLLEPNLNFDIGIIGVPYDGASSYYPGEC